MANKSSAGAPPEQPATDDDNGSVEADWHRRVVGRSLRTAAERSVDRGNALIAAAAAVLERSDGADITVQEVADEAGQSLRTLYQYFESKDDLLLALFEEAMRFYARAIRAAVADLDDPLERLAGAMVAAGSMASFSRSAIDRGMARLRNRLGESRPDLVGRAQQDLTALVTELVADAAEANRVTVTSSDKATFMVLSLNAAFITADLLGNDAGVIRPDLTEVVTFCLLGLGADVDATWVDGVTKRVELPSTVEWFASAGPAPRRKGATKRRTNGKSKVEYKATP